MHCKYPYVNNVILNDKHVEYKWVKLSSETKTLDGNGVYNETRRVLDRFYQDYIAFPASLNA